MKKIIQTLLFILILCTYTFAQETKKVLFLGNSYTAYNSLPNMVASIATSFGDVLIQDSNTPGGYTFNGHSTNATSITKINSQNWDYVVLQEQSQLPSFSPAQVESDVYPYADSLNRMVMENDSCTQVMFYMTWGRKNGDASNCAFYPPVCTYDGMQGRLRASYIEMANDLDAEVAPVGVVWRKFRQDFPSVELYSPDESHPSVHGSYLAACTFYASIYHKSPVGAFVPSGITALDASNIQNTVEAIVFDSLNIWRIDTSTINANFNLSNISGNDFSFTPDFINGDSYYWDFGDGNDMTSGTSNAVQHTYTANGNYVVTLIVNRGCESDTITQNISAGSLSYNEISKNDFSFYPNPTDHSLFIQSNLNGEMSILDLTGKRVFNSIISSGRNSFDITFLPAGTYLIRLQSEEKLHTQKLVKLK